MRLSHGFLGVHHVFFGAVFLDHDLAELFVLVFELRDHVLMPFQHLLGLIVVGFLVVF